MTREGPQGPVRLEGLARLARAVTGGNLEAGVLVLLAKTDGWLPRFMPDPRSGEEIARCSRLLRAEDRLRSLTAHVLKRLALSIATGLSPEVLAFVTDANGKPCLMADGQLRFNLSHSGPWCVLALTRGRNVGVDVQTLDEADAESLPCELVCHPDEETARWDKKTAICRWSLKEALLKAHGIGLAHPMEKVRLVPGPGGRWTARLFDKTWFLTHRRLEDGSSLAVCADTPCPTLLVRVD